MDNIKGLKPYLKKLIRRGLSSLVVGVFLVNTIFFDIAIAQPLVSTLAPLAASENPKVKREITASMYRASRFIWLANSPRYLDLLARYNAHALLLPSGRYLMAPETASNDLALIRSATHEDNEILMQQEEKVHPTRYNRLMRQIFGRDDIMKLYRALSHYKESDKQPNNIMFNDLIAKAFEILSIINENLVYPSELKLKEREFITLMRPVLQDKNNRNRYKNFSQVFFDTDKRTKAIKALQENKDERFYRAASALPEGGRIAGVAGGVTNKKLLGERAADIVYDQDMLKLLPEDIVARIERVVSKFPKNWKKGDYDNTDATDKSGRSVIIVLKQPIIIRGEEIDTIDISGVLFTEENMGQDWLGRTWGGSNKHAYEVPRKELEANAAFVEFDNEGAPIITKPEYEQLGGLDADEAKAKFIYSKFALPEAGLRGPVVIGYAQYKDFSSKHGKVLGVFISASRKKISGRFGSVKGQILSEFAAKCETAIEKGKQKSYQDALSRVISSGKMTIVAYDPKDAIRAVYGEYDFVSMYRAYGRALRNLNDAGFYPRDPHDGNVWIDLKGSDDPIWFDVGTWKLAKDLTKAQRLGYRYWALMYGTLVVSRDMGTPGLTYAYIAGQIDPLNEFLRGYFYDVIDDPGFHVDEFAFDRDKRSSLEYILLNPNYAIPIPRRSDAPFISFMCALEGLEVPEGPRAPRSGRAEAVERKNPSAPKGASATLLKYMFGYRNGMPNQAEPIGENNALMPKDMAKQRGGNDSLSNIYRELAPLERAGLVVGDKGNPRYLPAWVLKLNPEEIIRQNPELEQPALYESAATMVAEQREIGLGGLSPAVREYVKKFPKKMPKEIHGPRGMYTGLVLEAMERIKPIFRGADVLDVGTGSTVLARVSLEFFGASHVVATDIPGYPFHLVKQYAPKLTSGVANRLEILTGYLFEPVRGRKFDIALCNADNGDMGRDFIKGAKEALRQPNGVALLMRPGTWEDELRVIAQYNGLFIAPIIKTTYPWDWCIYAITHTPERLEQIQKLAATPVSTSNKPPSGARPTHAPGHVATFFELLYGLTDKADFERDKSHTLEQLCDEITVESKGTLLKEGQAKRDINMLIRSGLVRKVGTGTSATYVSILEDDAKIRAIHEGLSRLKAHAKSAEVKEAVHKVDAPISNNTPLNIHMQDSYMGRYNGIQEIIEKLPLLGIDAPDVFLGERKVVDVGVGGVPFATCELAHFLKLRNPQIEIVGTELPGDVAKAHIFMDSASLDAFRSYIIEALAYFRKNCPWKPNDITSLRFVVNNYGVVTSALAGFGTFGVEVECVTLDVSPDVTYLAQGKELQLQAHGQVFQELYKYVEDLVEPLFMGGKDTTIGGVKIVFDPTERRLKTVGAELIVSNSISEHAKTRNADIVIASFAVQHMTEAQKKIFKEEVVPAMLQEKGVCIIKNRTNKDLQGGDDASDVEVYQKRGNQITLVGSALSDNEECIYASEGALARVPWQKKKGASPYLIKMLHLAQSRSDSLSPQFRPGDDLAQATPNESSPNMFGDTDRSLLSGERPSPTRPSSTGDVQQAFSALDSEARKTSQLSSSVSRLRGTSQNLMEVNRFKFCLPIEVLRNSPDIALALNSAGLLKQRPQDAENIEFELVVTGVTDEDVKLIEGLNRDDIKKALNLPKKFTVSTITEAQIQETAQRFDYDASNPKNRVVIVKDFFSGALAKGEYMAIATDALDSAEKADALKEELERELKAELSEENISIRVLVRSESGKSMYSLSKIINDWLEAINQGNLSTISRILPIPSPLTPELERAIKAAWAVLIAA